jgi:Zn finger protein HypA/HybF involved in hydrogenase expression
MTPPSDIDEAAVCYLCLDGALDDADQPLRRDCSCRGTDAGYVHLTCLTKYAEIKCEEARDMNQFKDPWERCPSCDQYYQNDFSVDIASKFVSFVRRQNPDDTQSQVEALYVKLCTMTNMLKRLKPV